MRTIYRKFLHLRLTSFLRSLALCTLLLSVVSCGKDTQLPELSADATIVAFGDSLTKGKGVTTEKAYPAVLERITLRTVINAGISGETTSEGLTRLPEVLQNNNPDLLLLFEGGNDILRNQDLSVTKRNLSAMITFAKEQDIPVVLIGVPKKSLLGKTASFYTELAEEHAVPLEKSIVAKLLRDSSMKSDSVHFNVAGYAALAEAIADLLEKHGAIE